MAATTEIHVTFDCVNVDAQAAFWVGVLDYIPHGSSGQYRSLIPPSGLKGPKFVLQQTGEPKAPIKNRLHLDLVVGHHLDAEVARLVDLGATRLTPGTIDEAGTSWVVMADPEGNEFCLVVR